MQAFALVFLSLTDFFLLSLLLFLLLLLIAQAPPATKGGSAERGNTQGARGSGRGHSLNDAIGSMKGAVSSTTASPNGTPAPLHPRTTATGSASRQGHAAHTPTRGPNATPNSARNGGGAAAGNRRPDMDSVTSHAESEGIGELIPLGGQPRAAGAASNRLRISSNLHGPSAASAESARQLAARLPVLARTETGEEVTVAFSAADGSRLYAESRDAAALANAVALTGLASAMVRSTSHRSVHPAAEHQLPSPGAAGSPASARPLSSGSNSKAPGGGAETPPMMAFSVSVAENGAPNRVSATHGNGARTPEHTTAGGCAPVTIGPGSAATDAAPSKPALHAAPSEGRLLRTLNSARSMARMGDQERVLSEALESRKLAMDVAGHQLRRQRRVSIK